MSMNELILGIEGLINWMIFILKWSLITAAVSLVFIVILMCTLHVLKVNNIKLPRIELK